MKSQRSAESRGFSPGAPISSLEGFPSLKSATQARVSSLRES